MRRTLLCVLLVLGVAVAAAAVDITLNDGTVIPAKSYTITGSYVMVVLPNGSKVAYDVADVDVEALRRAEEATRAASAEGEGDEAAGPQGTDSAFAGATAKSTGASTMAITDKDVEHIKSPEGAAGREKKKAGPPPGHQTGGQVLVQNLKYTNPEEGVWRVNGEVINRLTAPVTDVRVRLEATTKQQQLTSVEKVIGSLDPGRKGVFEQEFKVQARPQLRIQVYWMQSAAEQPAAKPAAAGAGAAAGEQKPPGSASLTGQPSRPMQWGGGGYRRAGAAPTPTPAW